MSMLSPRPYLSQAPPAAPGTVFGSPRDRYQTLASSIASSKAASPSKYFKDRGEHLARSTAREKCGASGNSPAVLAGYSQNGAPMRGVTSFPFEKQQNAYVEEFAPIVANQLVHPFNAITENNADSTAHSIITGSAYSVSAQHASEYKRAYQFGAGAYSARAASPRTFSKGPAFPGLRSEEMITVGQYTPVLRSGSPRAGYTAG